MTAPERRRPLPALAFIGALCLLTAVVWFRVIHRTGTASPPAASCTPGAKPTAAAVKVVPHERKVSVLVLNSTNRKGIAGATKKALVARGFTVTDARNDSATYGGHGPIRGVAEVRYGPSALAAATLVQYYVPHSVLKPTDASSNTVTVSLGEKFKRIATAKAAHRALHANHIKFGKVRAQSTSSSGC
jgi:hypothetical protein